MLTQPADMFADIVKVAEEKARVRGSALEGLSLRKLAEELNGRPLRVATMCSGTESPLLALDLICRALNEQHGVSLNVEHAFSCEIEPFKQAYIERNFAPPILFRDIRELDREAATTAYGAMQPVPGDVDILIAGTSCVDYSNLNTKQKGIDQKGESGQTFWGMLGWVKRHRPPMVIQENVCGAPWEQMVNYYGKEGYSATFLRVDTKQHYVPHTRTRVYLLAIDMAAPDRRAAMRQGRQGLGAGRLPKAAEGQEGDAEQSSVEGDARAAAAELQARQRAPQVGGGDQRALPPFVVVARGLPAADGRPARPPRPRRHVQAQERLAQDRRLGALHHAPRARAQRGDARQQAAAHAVGLPGPRDAARLCVARLGQGAGGARARPDGHQLPARRGRGQDANYKTLVWNLSQNVDRETGASRPGLCPCLTPNMVPYVTNRGGPLIGHEVLSLQGIPVDDLLLTRESTDQMADLAGNAMSSTIVGTCILAALLLGRDHLLAFEQPQPDGYVDGKCVVGADGKCASGATAPPLARAPSPAAKKKKTAEEATARPPTGLAGARLSEWRPPHLQRHHVARAAAGRPRGLRRRLRRAPDGGQPRPRGRRLRHRRGQASSAAGGRHWPSCSRAASPRACAPRRVATASRRGILAAPSAAPPSPTRAGPPGARQPRAAHRRAHRAGRLRGDAQGDPPHVL